MTGPASEDSVDMDEKRLNDTSDVHHNIYTVWGITSEARHVQNK